MPGFQLLPTTILRILTTLILSVSWPASWAEQATPCSEASTRCTFAVFPHTNIRQLEETYTAIAEDFSILLDINVRFLTASSMQRFADHVEALDYDIALIGPGQYVTSAAPAGYIPIAKVAKPLTYELVVNNKSPIKSIADIKGKRLGTMAQYTGTYFGTTILLQEADLNPGDYTDRPFRSQGSCAQALAAGIVDVCSFASPIFSLIKLQLPNKFRSIAISKENPGSVYITHPEMSPETRRILQEHLLESSGIIVAEDQDFDPYRQLEHIKATH